MVTELANQVNKSISELLNGVHTAVPGKILEFDKAKCEAAVMPCGKLQKPDGSFIDYPKINEVPVMMFQGNNQKTTIAFPVLPGDECILIVSEYTLDTWRGSGEESENDLKFDLTNAVAIVGLFVKANQLAAEAVDDDALIIEHNKNRVIFKGEDEVKVHLSGDTSQVTLTPDKITMQTAGDIELNADGNISINAKGNFNAKANGNVSVSADSNTLIQGARVDINP